MPVRNTRVCTVTGVSDDTGFQRRFGGIARLYGDAALQMLADSHVCIVGIGGVGSWATEALARSAVGKLTLVDLDIVSESNINRQIHSLSHTVGRNKVDVMAERIREINADAEVYCIDDFITTNNVDHLLVGRFDYIVDCVDSFRVKAALINHCKHARVPVITIGGAGGQSDPMRIRVADLARTEHDPLLARTRKLLRQDYGFSRNLKRRFDVPCVYSAEQLVFPTAEGGISPTRPEGMDASDLGCAGGIGSVSTVTASFGLVAAAHVLDKIIQ